MAKYPFTTGLAVLTLKFSRASVALSARISPEEISSLKEGIISTNKQHSQQAAFFTMQEMEFDANGNNGFFYYLTYIFKNNSSTYKKIYV